jgi:glucose-1-phosphate adenylyltransferase
MIDALKELTTIIMAGGKGERLFPLTRDKAKPAITFGGIYKIIDFTLSNCLNSGIRRIYVLTQYGSFSLDQHLRAAWDIMHPDLGEFIYSMPPQQIMVSRWYRGTADSIYQNLTLLQSERPEQVLILSGDHVYKMNYLEMLDFHLAHHADMTVAAVPVPRAEASSFGILKVDATGAVENFLEKPAKPPSMPGSTDFSLSSMGVYIFRAQTLVEEVIKDAKKKTGKHDFGGDIIPQMVGRKRVFAFNFADPGGSPRYWRDIGLLDAYFRAHRDLLGASPTFDLFDADWPLRGRPQLQPPSRYITSPGACLAVGDSLIASGCIIEGTVDQAVLSPGVRIGRGATVQSAILWDGVEIGPGATIKRAIIEDGVKIPPNFHVGLDPQQDAKRFHVTENGLVIVPNNVILEE